MTLYVLIYPKLGPSLLADIERFRRRHEPGRAALVAAHITVGFAIHSVPADALIAHVRHLALGVEAFDLSFSSVKPCWDRISAEHKLFLMIEHGRDQLIALHDALYLRLPAEDKPHGPAFEPHMTIATASHRQAIEIAITDAAFVLPIVGTADELSIVELDPDGLRTLASIELAKPTVL
jgi:2'-5' RNA ligase